MKKFLLATTALVAVAAIASPANAAEKIKLGVGGYMSQFIGFTDNEDDVNVREFATFDTQSDTEIIFSGNTTLDNGIKISARMDLEGDAVGSSVDEAYMTIQTAYGLLKIGQDDGASDDFANNLERGQTGDHNRWVVPAGVTRGAMGNDTYSAFGGDHNKINYQTPRLFDMLQVGVSYAPEQGSLSADNSTTPNRIGGTSSAIAAGADFKTKLGEVGIHSTYAYAKRGGDGARATTAAQVVAGGALSTSGHHVSLEFDMAGFKVGGAYGRQFGNHEVATDDGQAYHLSLSYKSGPMLIGIYRQDHSTEQAAGGGEDEMIVNSVFFNYDLSDGVKWQSFVFKSDYDSGVPNLADASFNSGGWGVVGGVKLSF